MSNYFFSLREILKEEQQKVSLDNTNDFFIETVTEINTLLGQKAVGVQMNTSEPMIISYETGTFQWSVSLDGDITFFIFYSQTDGESGIYLSADSVKLTASLSVAINIISNYYFTTLLFKIQKNMPTKAF